MKRTIFYFSIVLCMILFGCKAKEKIVYMQDVPLTDTTYVVQSAQDITIRPGDKFSIIVTTSIPEMAATFNLSVPYRYAGTQSNNSVQEQISFYVVDNNGNIDFPVLGEIHVQGLTRQQICELIKGELISKNLLKDAVVNIEYGNLTFSVIGEVKSPGRYNFDRDHITILEAISMAHDLTITGVRENVLVTRSDEKGNLMTYRVDLRNNAALLASPVYYVQQNDIIYVQPNGTRSRESTVSANTFLTPAFWISLATLATTITALVIK